jgi:hypothetical protein
MDTRTLEFLDYLCPRLKDFVTHNFITKWQNKVELPCLILHFRIFEGPLQVICMCKLFYIGHLTYKINVFIDPFVGTMFNLHKGFENPKSLLFWSYIRFFIHVLDPLQVLFLVLAKSFACPFFSLGQVLCMPFF